MLRQMIQFGFSIALARLLAPEEFGVLAMLYVFVGLASVVAEGGLGAALIHRVENTPSEESSVFHFNATIGFTMALMLCAAAPSIERFYGYPGLASIAMAMAANVFISALGSVHGALLVRELRLGLQLRIGLISGITSGLVAIFLALRGFGVWSLVAQVLVANILNTALLWLWHRWRPTHPFSLSAIRPLLRYGSALMLAGALDLIGGRLYTLLVGRFHGAAPLGLYMRAVTTQTLPQLMVGAAMRQVTFPILSAEQGDLEQVRLRTRSVLQTAMLLHTPCLLGIAATAEWLVPFLFGAHWSPSAPILQILCVAGVLYPISHANLTVLKALGQSRLFLKLEILKKTVLVALFIASVPFGLVAVAWSQVGSSLVALAVNARYSHRLIGYGLGMQIRDAGPSLALGTVMAWSVWLAGRTIDQPDAITLLVQIPIGVTIYVFGVFFLRLVGISDVLSCVSGLRKLISAAECEP